MPSASAIRAGRAFVEFFSKDSKFVKSINANSKRLKAIGTLAVKTGAKIAGMGAAMVGPLLAASHVFRVVGDQLEKMSHRTGFSVEALSELNHAAQIGGTSVESLEGGLRRMQRSLYDAERGLATPTDALKDLGLTIDNLRGKKPEDQFTIIAGALSKVEDDTRKAGIAMGIFGRQGTALFPMIADGAEGIERLRKEARELGLVMSTEDAKAAAAWQDAWYRIIAQVKQATFQIGGALAPALTDLFERSTKYVKLAIDWVKQNKALILTVAKVGAIILAAGAAITAIGAVIVGLGATLASIGVIIATVAVALKAMIAMLVFLVSPIGLVIAAVVALGGYFLYASGLGTQALDWLGQQARAFGAAFKRVWTAIVDAVKSGDLKLAFTIAWAAIKVVWLRAVQTLREIWIGFKQKFMDIWRGAQFKIAEIAIKAWSGLQALWTEVLGFIKRGWANLYASFKTVQTRFSGWFSKQWLQIYGKIKGHHEQVIAESLKTEDRLTRHRLQEIAKARKEQLADIADWQTQAHADTIRNEQATLAVLEATRKAEAASRKKGYQKELDAAQAAVAGAQGELDQLIQRSRDKAAGMAGALPSQRDIIAWNDRLINTAGARLAATSGLTGATFSAFEAARGLGAMAPLQQMVDLQTDIRDSSAETAKNTRDMGPLEAV